MKRKNWFEREFNNRLEPGIFPGILERLIGTPARMEEKIKQFDPDLYTIKFEGDWSIQENAGHLADLEPLWIGRIKDFVNGETRLREADLTNKTTDLANHNAKSIETILAEFRNFRQELTDSLFKLKDSDLEKTSLHPRLQTPMKIIDLAHFIAEHDDHHLAQMTFLANKLSE